MDDIELFSFPCGCIADVSCIFVDFANGVVECPWCRASFLACDLRQWFEGGTQTLWLEGGPGPLFKCGSIAVEYVRLCDCGCPLVRTGTGSALFHLNAPPSSLERLRH